MPLPNDNSLGFSSADIIIDLVSTIRTMRSLPFSSSIADIVFLTDVGHYFSHTHFICYT
jgi:hypothetical protein